MSDSNAFTHVDPDLLPVLDELRAREPIFHTRAFGLAPEKFERAMAPGYWEVGASGRRYTRELILSWALKMSEHFVDANEAGLAH